MKRAANNEADILKGVSTLDAFLNRTLKILSSPLTLILIFFTGVSFGARGHSTLDLIDPNFDPEIKTGSYNPKTIRDIITLPDGKILIGGVFNSFNGKRVGTLIRLNPDGTIDKSFKNQTLTTITGLENHVNQIIVQSDGKIIVRLGNSDFTVNDPEPEDIIRLHPDGSVDQTFDYDGDAFAEPFVSFEQLFNSREQSIKEEYVGNPSDFVTIDASNRLLFIDGNSPQIRRLNYDGSTDTSAQFPTLNGLHTIAAQGNKIIVSSSTNSNEIKIQRFNEDGSPDTSFSNKTLNTLVSRFLIQPDKKILLMLNSEIRRLNADGTVDESFNAIADSSPRDFYLANDGKIVVFSHSFSHQVIKKYLSNGEADITFTPYTFPNAPFQIVSTIAATSDGGVVIGDQLIGVNAPQIPNGFSKLNSDGNLDITFNAGGNGFQSVLAGKVRTIAIQKDQKIIIGGNFDFVNDTIRHKVARLNADSTIDTSFQLNTGSSGNTFTRMLEIYKISIQKDGKLLISGNFDYQINGVTKSNVVRLNTNGSIDPTFVLGVTLVDAFGCCGGGKNITSPLDNGKIIVANSRLGGNDAVPISLNNNGSLDSSFNSNIFSDQNVIYIWGLAVQADGKVIIGGNHIGGSGSKSFVARLETDGSVDSSFQINEQADRYISDLALLPNGKVLVVIGDQYSNNPTPQQSDIFRLNSNGTVDNSFDAGTSADGRINILVPLNTGQILVGGDFQSFDGQPRKNLAQLNENGSLVSVKYKVNAEVYSLAFDKEQRLLVGGKFTQIGTGEQEETDRKHMARIISSGQTSNTRLDFDGDGLADLGVFNSKNGVWRIFKSQSNETTLTQFGLSEDITVPADFDGDGKTDIAVYRPSEGNWYLNQTTDGFAVIRWGIAEDMPVPADFDDDGKADLAVWRPSTGTWYVLSKADFSYTIIQFGTSGDIPLQAADLDGDNKADIAVWRPSNGTFYWLESGSNYRFRTIKLGQRGDIPAIGDYNGDEKTDLVLFRPSEGKWHQMLSNENSAYTFSTKEFGEFNDEPVVADYDGDGKTDLAVRRENVWHILYSGEGRSVATFGESNTKAIAALRVQTVRLSTPRVIDRIYLKFSDGLDLDSHLR